MDSPRIGRGAAHNKLSILLPGNVGNHNHRRQIVDGGDAVRELIFTHGDVVHVDLTVGVTVNQIDSRHAGLIGFTVNFGKVKLVDFHYFSRLNKLNARNPRVKLVLLLVASLMAAGIVNRARSQAEPAPQWRTVPTEAYPKKRDDIVFADARTGFYGTGKGKLYRTEDGGQSWQLLWSKPGTFIRALGFIDAKHGFLGNLGAGLGGTTDTTPLYETKDGGSTWEPAKIGTAAVPGVCAIDILKSRSIHEGNVFERYYIHAAGRANGPAKLLRSEDGGDTWVMIDLSDRAGMILDTKFFDPNIGFVFAGTSGDLSQSNALILKTTDGARTWRQVYRSARPNEIIWKASFVNSSVGYATVQNDDPETVNQHILKTTDGGEHWLEVPFVASKGMEEMGVGFVSPDKGWVGSNVGGFETLDGGKTWAPSSLAPKANKIRTRAVDGTPMIYAIGSEVQVYR